LLRTHTYDISENGISLIFDFPEYIPPEEEITIRLATDRNETEWSGKVANVMQIGSKWKYGISMQKITEPNKRQMMQIVYDRDPTLPRTMENGLSTMDDLALNIEYRKKSKKNFTSKKLPLAELDHTVTTKDGRKLVLETFDYKSLILWSPSKEGILQKLSFSEEGVVFECSLQEKISKHEASYQVDNLAELVGSAVFRTLLNTWITDCRQDKAQEKNYKKQIDATLNRYEVFDELQYLN
jgi:cellulose synthase (UDP-forming)